MSRQSLRMQSREILYCAFPFSFALQATADRSVTRGHKGTGPLIRSFPLCACVIGG